MLRLTRQLPASPESIRTARQLAVAFAGELCEPDERLLADVALCVSEAATNVVRHAYPDESGRGEMELAVKSSSDRLIISITDHGKGIERDVAAGAGLAIAGQLATVRVVNTGHGTAVSLSFPCNPLADDDERASSPHEQGHRI